MKVSYISNIYVFSILCMIAIVISAYILYRKKQSTKPARKSRV